MGIPASTSTSEQRCINVKTTSCAYCVYIISDDRSLIPTYSNSLETKLVRGKLLTTIPRLSTEWIVSFDYKMTEIFLPSAWLNIIHLTIGNDAAAIEHRAAIFKKYDLEKALRSQLCQQ